MAVIWNEQIYSALVDAVVRHGPTQYQKWLKVLAAMPIRECMGWRDDFRVVIDHCNIGDYRAIALRLHAYAVREIGTKLLEIDPSQSGMTDARKKAGQNVGLNIPTIKEAIAVASIDYETFAALVENGSPATVAELIEATAPARGDRQHVAIQGETALPLSRREKVAA